ncbi:MAG: UDP-N-acetylglucosamine 2-epimerase (non-hydrolyzing) [Thaumarchaeota archaeon]|nr:UDP-N-acetylglucosamine 2-epimerase (non-hydrolyzing) [Nitrososphaerota archaeon]
MKVSIILGTRPQIIKSAPVYHALRKKGVECDMVNTGQHYDYEMNRRFFSELDLPDPSADLGVGAGTPNEQVSGIIGGLGKLFAESRPDLALVPGDTNSALAAGIACSKSGVPVAHLEAGCRSDDFRMAEEVNRRVLDHMSQVLLCPTANCVRNVRSEHVLAGSISNVGDTMYDSLLKFKPSIEKLDPSTKYDLEAGYAFMTLHRAEAVDDPEVLRRVLGAVGSLGVPVAFSVHPRTRERIKEFGITTSTNIRLLEPLPYLEALAVVREAKFVITDSGGLQKEAYWLGKPVLIVRNTTEWGEIVDAGAAFLAGTARPGIMTGYKKIPHVKERAFRASRRIFGSGDASSKVVRVLSAYMSGHGNN